MTAAERLVARQLAMVGRRFGLGLMQAGWCRAKFGEYIGLEMASVELRRAAETHRAEPDATSRWGRIKTAILVRAARQQRPDLLAYLQEGR